MANNAKIRDGFPAKIKSRVQSERYSLKMKPRYNYNMFVMTSRGKTVPQRTTIRQ